MAHKPIYRRVRTITLVCCALPLWAMAAQSDPTVDRQILDQLQQQCLTYFWEGGDPITGLAFEASFEYETEGRPLAVGGTGFGIAAMIAGVERGWLERSAAVDRLHRICLFLRDQAPRAELHGAFPHWLHRGTGAAIRFSELDDGADLVETALLMQGLLLARSYFNGSGVEAEIREIIDAIWHDIEWDWFVAEDGQGLYWHWSPLHDFGLGLKIQGYNECLIVYVLAAASPTHPVEEEVLEYWWDGDGYQTRDAAGYQLEAATSGGGPLFFSHYSFIGLDPRQIADHRVPSGYMVRNTRHVLANRGYCLYQAPSENQYNQGYWGLTASLIPNGYAASEPDLDTGTVAPTAALASFPYTPHYSFQVLQYLRERYPSMWGEYGPYDALNLRDEWAATEYLAIDQLPIPAMIENYRSGLFWQLFMDIPEIREGLRRSGMFKPPFTTGFPEIQVTMVPDGVSGFRPDAYETRRHPDAEAYLIPYWAESGGQAEFILYDGSGTAIFSLSQQADTGRNTLRLPYLVSEPGRLMRLRLTIGVESATLPIRLY